MFAAAECPNAKATLGGLMGSAGSFGGGRAGIGRDSPGFRGSRGWCKIESASQKTPVAEEARVPRISAFYGIAIYMYYRDHAPPHFRAIYGDFEATVAIATAEVLEGRLPRRARALVSEWAEAHRDELEHSWELARASQPLPTIAGLE
jgi:hypothetical protein